MEGDDSTNEQLLESYKKGSYEAFNLFYKRNHKIIFSFIVTRMKSKQLAEEVFQEVFIKIHKHILGYDSHRSAMNWVFAIAKNTSIRAQSQSKEVPTEFVDEAQDSSSEYQFFQKEILNDLDKILAPLSEEERELIKRRYFLEEDYNEISKSMKLSPANARQKVVRIMKKLKSNAS